MIQKSYDDSPSLYLIPTPIGNMDDITVRSLNVLKSVDEILCEDTRDSSVLLNHFGIKKKLVSCHEYNEDKIIEYVINKLKGGLNIGLITDQGTPIISDPGYIVANAVIRNGFNVISLPGATAFTPAVTSSGIRPYPFLFYGFLNAKKSKQVAELKSLEKLQYTLVFYESVHRLKETLENMLEVFGNRDICVCREISKIYEEYIRGSISEVLPLADSLKGEFVLVVEGNLNTIDYSSLGVVEHVQLYLNDMSEMDAIKKVAKERGVAKSEIYQEYHNRK